VAPRDEALRAVEKVKGVRRAEVVGDQEGEVRLRVESDPGERLVAALDRLAREKGWPLLGLAERPLSLEETFIALTGREGAAAGRPEGEEEVRP